MEALLDHTARLLGSVLNLRSDDKQDKPLAQLMPREVEVFPTREKLDELDKVRIASKFVSETEFLALELLSLAQNAPEDDINMADYACRHGMFGGWSFHKRKGQIMHKFRVGEIAHRASEKVAEKVFSWLITCDNMMCSTLSDFGDADGGRDATDSEMHTLCRFLSEKIASFVTSDGGEGLSVPLLENRVRAEVMRNQARAEAAARDCMVALTSLHKLAKHGSSTDESMEVIENSMHHIRWIMVNIPPEICRSEIPAINPDLLEEACNPEHDLELRCSLVDNWKNKHGRITEDLACRAIAQLKEWMESKKPAFEKVVECHADRRSAPAHLDKMPALPFVHSGRSWVFVSKKLRGVRSGLDYRGRRVRRLVSMVWELFGHGEIRRGIVSASTLRDVANTALFSAQNVSKLLDIKRSGLAPGCHLLSKVCAITDFHGDLSDEMTNLLCEVSMFSYQDLHEVLSHTAPVASYIMTPLSRMTRKHVIHHVPERYFAVAHDTVRIVLPILHTRRSMLGRRPDYIPNPVVEVLQTIRKVREWSPMQGKLVLSVEDLNGAARMTTDMFRALEERRFLVQRKRVYVGNGMKSARLVYVFDTPALLKLLNASDPPKKYSVKTSATSPPRHSWA
tara:strand:- start:101 stop:1972 length:1872 start_codon:yes stop_codon:yes gene_type:complete